MREPAITVRAEDEPSWAEVVRRAEHGESVSVIAHGDHVADVVPSGELDRLREMIWVLSDTELVLHLQEDLPPMRAPGACSPLIRSQAIWPPAAPWANEPATPYVVVFT